MQTANGKKPFNVEEYLTHPDLKEMYPVDLDLIMQNIKVTDSINDVIKVCLDKQYISVGQFIEDKPQEYLLSVLKKLENADPASSDFNESTLLSGLLAFAEGETCLSWLSISKYRGLLYFYLKLTLMSRVIKLKIKHESFTMSADEAVRKVFYNEPVSVGELFNFYAKNGSEGLFIILQSVMQKGKKK